MRVAFLVPGPWETVSGGYVYDRRIADGLRALGHRVDVILLEGAHPDPAQGEAARVAWAAVPADAVPVVDGLGLPAFAGMAATLTARGAVGLIHHPTALETGLPEALRGALDAAEHDLFPAMGRLIATSRTTADALAGRGISRRVIATVEPGTDPAPRSSGSGGPCSVLALGTLIPRKGHDVLLRALGRLPDLAFRVTIAGGAPDPTYADSLRRLADELGLAGRVAFPGVLTGAELEAAWDAADVFALATWHEGYGMAIAEALRRGVPVAVCDGGAAAALVTARAGIVAPPAIMRPSRGDCGG